MKTKAAILVEQRQPLEVVDLELPSLTFGQVLVRVETSGVCASQIGEIDGKKGPDRYLPHCLGHEATGIVEEIGPCVTTVEAGQRVVLHWRQGAGIQAPTPTYRWGERTVNAGWVTTFQERTIVSENRITPIPLDFDADSAVLYGCAFTTGYGVICRDARVLPGESVVILGTGGVGLCCVIAARLAGAHPIVAVDVVDAKLELARTLGATHAINSKTSDLRAAVPAALGPKGADVVVENTGVLRVMQDAYALAGPRGRTILVGVPGKDEKLPIDTMPLHFGKVLTGSFGGQAQPDVDIPRLVRLQQAGRFDLKPLLSHRWPLERINEAIEALRAGQVVRCAIDCQG